MAKRAKKQSKTERAKKCTTSKPRKRSASASVRNTGSGGRPDLFESQFCERAKRYCSRYKADWGDLAKEFKVSERTIFAWMAKYPKFKKAIEEGRALAAGPIELNLRQLAMPHDEVQEEHELRGKGKNKKLVVVKRKIKKGCVDVTAAIKVLAADDPKRFGNKVSIGGDEGMDPLRMLITEIRQQPTVLPQDEKKV